MDTTSDKGTATAPHPPSDDHPFGPDGAAILATEHWSLLASRSLLWNEAQSRATVFLSVLSAATQGRLPALGARPADGAMAAGCHGWDLARRWP